MTRHSLIVVAAVIERDGAVLVTRRQPGTHLEGFWEFPGGKCHPGESLQAALEREIREELDCGAVVGRQLLKTSHGYSDRRLELHFYVCGIDGSPRPRLGQEMRWVPRADLRGLMFPPADAELVEMLASSEGGAVSPRPAPSLPRPPG